MKRLRSALLSLVIISTFGVVFEPIQVRADEGGDQNTSNSQSSGTAQYTTETIVKLVIRMLGL